MTVLRCPVCGAEDIKLGALGVYIPPYEGKYCLACLAKWISENIPELVEKEDVREEEVKGG